MPAAGSAGCLCVASLVVIFALNAWKSNVVIVCC